MLVAFSSALLAQDEAFFNQYLVSPILVNPAVAGYNEQYELQLNARLQHTGFDDSPRLIAARANGPIGRTFGLGVGIVTETAAQQRRLEVQLDYAFRFDFGREVLGQKEFKMAFGFYTAYEQLSIDNDVMSNPLFRPGDETLQRFLNGDGEFDAAVGIYGRFRENTFVGITVNNLVSSRLQNIAGTANAESAFSYYTLQLGHRIPLEFVNGSIEPSVLIRQLRNAPAFADLNLKGTLLDGKLIGAISYRTLGNAGFLIGTQIQESFQLYYSYDYSFERFQRYNSGSHELMIAYALDPIKLKSNRRRRRARSEDF